MVKEGKTSQVDRNNNKQLTDDFYKSAQLSLSASQFFVKGREGEPGRQYDKVTLISGELSKIMSACNKSLKRILGTQEEEVWNQNSTNSSVSEYGVSNFKKANFSKWNGWVCKHWNLILKAWYGSLWYIFLEILVFLGHQKVLAARCLTTAESEIQNSNVGGK